MGWVLKIASVDRGVSPLMSNNPFRNRIASTTSTGMRPVSTNPFLDTNEVTNGLSIPSAKPAPENINSTAEMLVCPGSNIMNLLIASNISSRP